jgi:hypothetical protein
VTKAKPKNSAVIQGTYFRWVVPQLDPQVWSRKEAWKAEVLDRLLRSKTARKGVRCYSLAVQSHADGNPHLDLFLGFQKKVRLRYTELDFLCDKHGDLTRYRSLNAAILAYGSKEDTPLSNFASSVSSLLFESEVQKDAFVALENVMKRDPLNFDLLDFVTDRGLLGKIRNWFTVKGKLKDSQVGHANQALRRRPGVRFITPALVRQRLSPEELARFQSWTGYCRICSFVNEVAKYGCDRPFKSRQLLLVGPPNTGKTSLNRELARWIPTYQVGMTNWWPEYRDNVYRLFSWNEFSLNKMPYTQLLKLLEGTPLNLQKKGTHAPRFNNQLILMNSNLTIVQHLRKKFLVWTQGPQFRASLLNLPARVEQIVIPEGYDLFLLLKLILPNTSDDLPSSDLSCTL